MMLLLWWRCSRSPNNCQYSVGAPTFGWFAERATPHWVASSPIEIFKSTCDSYVQRYLGFRIVKTLANAKTSQKLPPPTQYLNHEPDETESRSVKMPLVEKLLRLGCESIPDEMCGRLLAFRSIGMGDTSWKSDVIRSHSGVRALTIVCTGFMSQGPLRRN